MVVWAEKWWWHAWTVWILRKKCWHAWHGFPWNKEPSLKAYWLGQITWSEQSYLGKKKKKPTKLWDTLSIFLGRSKGLRKMDALLLALNKGFSPPCVFPSISICKSWRAHLGPLWFYWSILVLWLCVCVCVCVCVRQTEKYTSLSKALICYGYC